MTRQHTPSAHELNRNQQGMVAIMVTMILMIVISLLVLAFAEVSRRNQRTTLDRQLSTQAFYAAESGINDARKLINDRIAAGQAITSKTSCAPASNGMYVSLPSNVLNTANDVSYSCLLVNTLPTSLRYDTITSNSTIVPLISSNGNFSTLSMTWKTKDTTTTPLTNCPAGPNVAQVFSLTSAWNCGYGVLRFDIVPVNGGGLTAATLQDSTMTTFAVPAAAGTNSIGFSAGNNAKIANACNNTSCTLTITGLNTDQYYMRVSTIYKNVSLEIAGTTQAGTAVQFTEAQAVIDATGKAQDVLRRLQVRIPVSETGSQNLLPGNALQSTDSICKRFSVMDGYYGNNVPGFISGTNQLCAP